MDIRKVESVVRKICVANTSDSIQVRITDDIDSLENKDTILAIGSEKTIKYEYLSTAEMVKQYFEIIDNKRAGVLSLIDKQKINISQYFPIYGFSIVNPDIKSADRLKSTQDKNLINYLNRIKPTQKKKRLSISEVNDDSDIAHTYKTDCILWNVWKNNIKIDDLESYLRDCTDKTTTNYRKLICLYDQKRYK